MKNFGINQNKGDGTTHYTGQTYEKSSDFLEAYIQDNSMIMKGMIVDVFAGGYAAQVNMGNGTDVAIWLSNILNGISGTCEFTTMAIGTPVLVYKSTSGPAFILGAYPGLGSNNGSPYDIESAEIDTTEEKQHSSIYDGTQQSIPHHNDDRPQDALPGDWGVMGELGACIAVMRGLSLLKGSSLSQVQVHKLDQLVRIVAGTLEVFSAIGTTNIYNSHGNLTREDFVSTKQHESFGVEEDEDISKEDGFYFKNKKDEDAKEKHRIQSLIGYLGDLLKIFAQKPDGEGLAEVNIGTDGRVAVKSINEIEFRKVDKVKVPERKVKYFEEEEKETDDKKQFSYSDEISKSQQEADKDTWIDDEYNFRRFSRDNFDIKDDVPQPEDEDVEYTETKSKIIQRNDGSIAFIDSAGSKIELDGKGGITISCKNDAQIKCGKNTIVLAGNDLVLKSNNHCELVSTTGDVRIKAETALQMVSLQRGILLESQGEVPPNTEAGEDHEYSGIIIRSTTDSPVVLESQKNIFITSEENVIINAEAEAKIITDNFNINADEKVIIDTEKYQAQTSNYNIKTSEYLNQNTTFISTGSSFLLSGSSAGKIHGGSATDINHIHTADEFIYVTDCSLGGQKAVRITKTNTSDNRNIIDEQISQPQTLLNPFIKESLDITVFNYFKKVYDGKLFEESWQTDLENAWDLTADKIGETASFPGVDFSDYSRYIPNEKAADTAGETESVGLSEYKIN